MQVNNEMIILKMGREIVRRLTCPTREETRDVALSLSAAYEPEVLQALAAVEGS